MIKSLYFQLLKVRLYWLIWSHFAPVPTLFWCFRK